MDNPVNRLQGLVVLVLAPAGMIKLSVLAVLSIFLFITGCAPQSLSSCGLQAPVSPRAGVKVIFFFRRCGSGKQDVTVRFVGIRTGCATGGDFSDCNCPSGEPCEEDFSEDVTQIVEPTCSDCVSSECKPVSVTLPLRDGLRPGFWNVTARLLDGNPNPEPCKTLVCNRTLTTVNINDFETDQASHCRPPENTPPQQQFIMSAGSTITLARGPNQQVIPIKGGSLELVDRTILVNSTASLGDVTIGGATIGGVTFRDVTIRNASLGFIDSRPGTTTVIPPGSLPFNLSFNFNGGLFQQVLTPSNITVMAGNNSLQLSGQTLVQLDPDNPLRPEFAGLGMLFPFTVDIQITATLVASQPPIKCDRTCFRTPRYWLLNLNRLPGGPFLIGGVNFNAPTSDLQAIRLALRGNVTGVGSLTPLQQLNQQFVAAQLSLNSAGGGPVTPNLLWTEFSCYGGNLGLFAPVTLSNGFTFTTHSMLKDLFMQAGSAIRENRTADMLTLARFFESLNLSCR